MNPLASLMVIAAGMFVGGAVTFAWSRVPIWRRMPAGQFVTDFAQTIDRTDKVQPALLVLTIVSSVAFALGTDGLARTLALVGAAGFVLTLVASVAIMVPLQRTIIASPLDRPDHEEMRLRWYRGNLGRSVLATGAFLAVAAAATI